MKKTALWVSASVFALGCSSVAFADGPTPPPASSDPTSATTQQPGQTKPGTAKAEDDPKVEKVVVTAERRKTSAQKTPISVTVISGDDLEKKGVTSVDQLQFVAPGTTVNNFGQGIDFNIRGIGKGEHNTQTLTGVITYRDGVATFPGYIQEEPYYDVARVEILRGPQGTFGGQNATGGAVFVTTNNPEIGGDVHGYIAGQFGNYSDVAAQGAMNIPISSTLAARVAFNTESRNSFYDITGPFTGGDGSLAMGSGRVSLLWEPNTQLSVLFKTDYSYLDMGAYPADPVLSPNDLFDITSNAEQRAIDRLVRSVLKVDYVFESGITLRSVSGYQFGISQYRGDLDGTSAGNFTFRDSVDETIWSQEVNLVSSDEGPLTWTLGAYFQTDLHDFPPGQFDVGVPPGVFDYTLHGTNPTQAEAVFGQIGYEVLPGLQVQVGGRYTDTRTTNHVDINQYGTPLSTDQTAKFENFSGKISLGWTVDEHNYLYAFYATGFKPGGLNVPVNAAVAPPFDEEKVKEYEVGWKAGFFGGHLRTQLSAYYNDYDNFQVIVGYPDFPTFGFELNVPNTTKIYGGEAQAEAVFGAFSLDAGMGVMHSELGEFFAVDPRDPPGGFIPFFAQCNIKTGATGVNAFWISQMAPYCHNLGGQEQTYAPDFTFNIGLQYIFQIEGGDTLTPRVNYGHVSKQWATLFENEALGDKVESRDIFNVQLAYSHDDIIATLYGTNITDEHYVAAVNSGLRFAGAPRQFGIRIVKAF
jgi:iron complex outermembrane receptor protein